MFGNFKIKANVELECIFPEITNNTRNETINIKIPCYFDNKQHDLSIYFEGESESNQLSIDYSRYYNGFNLYKNCKKQIILNLEEIQETECKQFNSYAEYFYKIKLTIETIPQNVTIPEEIYNENRITLEIQKENKYYYYHEFSSCKLNANNNMNYLECSLYGYIDNLTLYFHNENKEYHYYQEAQDYKL